MHLILDERRQGFTYRMSSEMMVRGMAFDI